MPTTSKHPLMISKTPRDVLCGRGANKESLPPNAVDKHGNILVTDYDVLCGRGGRSNGHKGNHLFRRIVSENKKVYQGTDNTTHKHLVVVSIISAIHRSGGRFIEKKNGGWRVAPAKKAMTKTSQALREQENGRSKSSLAIRAATTKPAPPDLPEAIRSSNVSQRNITTVPLPVEAAENGNNAKNLSPLPAAIPSPTRSKSPIYKEKYFNHHRLTQKADKDSTSVIENELKKVLEELSDFDSGCDKLPFASEESAWNHRKGAGLSSEELFCADLMDLETLMEDQQDYLRPLGITDETSMIKMGECADMCSSLLSSLLSSC